MITARCAAHPGRPAVDACPVCERPRCGADAAAAPGGGCTVCLGGAPRARAGASTAGPHELLVRAALAGYAAAVGWGYVTAEYVGADLFQYLSPAVLGVLCGGAATAAAGSPRSGPLVLRVRQLSVLLAVLGSALGFVLEGTYGALSSSPDVLVPYAIAAAAAWLWTAPPRSKGSGRG
ncbi:MAG: hypothetical protein ACXVGH_03770 [Mycobacteriales bacterium]